MPANKPIKKKQGKAKAKETAPDDAELKAFVEQMQLKNEALKKIYDFFGNEINKKK